MLAGVISLLLAGFLRTPVNLNPELFTNFAEAETIWVLLFVALLAWSYWLPRMRPWQQWIAEMGRYPAVLRLATATITAYCLCLLIVAVPGAQSRGPGEFGPEITAILVGIGLTLVLLPNGWFGLPQSTRWLPRFRMPVPQSTTRTVMVLLLVGMLTREAFADCFDFICCFVGRASSAAAAVAGAIPALASVIGGPTVRSTPESPGPTKAPAAPQIPALTGPEAVRAQGRNAVQSQTGTALTGPETGAMKPPRTAIPTSSPEAPGTGGPSAGEVGGPLTSSERAAMQPPTSLTDEEGGAMNSPPPETPAPGSSPEVIGSQGQPPGETGGRPLTGPEQTLLADWW